MLHDSVFREGFRALLYAFSNPRNICTFYCKCCNWYQLVSSAKCSIHISHETSYVIDISGFRWEKNVTNIIPSEPESPKLFPSAAVTSNFSYFLQKWLILLALPSPVNFQWFRIIFGVLVAFPLFELRIHTYTILLTERTILHFDQRIYLPSYNGKSNTMSDYIYGVEYVSVNVRIINSHSSWLVTRTSNNSDSPYIMK